MCPFEPHKFGNFVFKELYLHHSSFCIDANLFRLKLRFGTLMWHPLFIFIFFQVECAEAQSLREKNVQTLPAQTVCSH